MNRYAGQELDLFAAARNWKRYWSRVVAPYVSGRVAEIGAGIGSNIPYLGASATSWVAVEQDVSLLARVPAAVGRLRVARVCGGVDALAPGAHLDTLLYADVLEHIADDCGEVARAAARLRPGGHLVVLSPALEALRSPFDDQLGHVRRYNRAAIGRLDAPGLTRVCLRFLDSAGMLASFGNRLLLRSGIPTRGQLAVWDGGLVPVSTRLDPLLRHAIGKSVVCVWRKTAP